MMVDSHQSHMAAGRGGEGFYCAHENTKGRMGAVENGLPVAARAASSVRRPLIAKARNIAKPAKGSVYGHAPNPWWVRSVCFCGLSCGPRGPGVRGAHKRYNHYAG